MDETDTIDWNTELTATGVESDFGVQTIQTETPVQLTKEEILEKKLEESERKRIQAEKDADFAWKAAESKQQTSQQLAEGQEYTSLMEDVLVAPLPESSTYSEDDIELSDPQPILEESPSAPPIPAGGLPEGWSEEQWSYYGEQWLEQQRNKSQATTPTEEDLTSLTVVELKKRLKSAGKKVSGKKAELIDRLKGVE
jgi:hypothetical protein